MRSWLLRLVIPATLCMTVTVASCGNGGGDSRDTVTPTATESPPRPTSTTESPPTSPAGGASARELTERLQAAELDITKVVVYTAESDPNHLLGRQGQYTSKTSWVDPAAVSAGAGEPTGESPGVEYGGGIEAFASAADAQRRYDYLRAFDPPFGDGYDYLADTALLRLSQYLTPDQAQKYKRAFEDAARQD